MSITIRKAKKGDEIGMSKVWRDGFKRKTSRFCHQMPLGYDYS